MVTSKSFLAVSITLKELDEYSDWQVGQENIELDFTNVFIVFYGEKMRTVLLFGFLILFNYLSSLPKLYNTIQYTIHKIQNWAELENEMTLTLFSAYDP